MIKIGYEIGYGGSLDLNKPLTPELAAYIENINKTEHESLEDMPEGWCPWLSDGNKTMYADSGEDYYTLEWLKYIIDNILKPKGYVLNGEIYWDGEESHDIGKFLVKDNKVKEQIGIVTYEDVD